MHPRDFVNRTDGRPALVMAGSGDGLSFAQLDRRANRVSQLLRARGLVAGDRVAIWLENDARWFELAWGAYNGGLLFVPVSSRLTAEEAAYIVADSGARLTFASSAFDHAGLASALGSGVAVLLLDAGYDAEVAGLPDVPVADERRGASMVYSSGTTGRPKGITPHLPDAAVGDVPDLQRRLMELYEIDAATTYLSSAPLYHTAPLKFCMLVQQAGGTVVMMERFDAAAALGALERYRVTHSQWVPTMFVRMLRLPEDIRRRDLPAHRYALHSAAPCPPALKAAMIEWWGPILYEYYGGSESIGQCAIAPDEWLAKPASVGRPFRGVLHVTDEAGQELGPGETGLVWFEGVATFSYHNDPEKTARAYNERGWATFGDIGHVDADGYLFLTDRRDYVINSGGVNIYPQEAENALLMHPAVQDAAVFGVPDAEFGEAVKAVVQPVAATTGGPAFEAELIDWCRDRLAHLKCPRSIDFDPDLPREPTGKLMKRKVKQRYWPAPAREDSR